MPHCGDRKRSSRHALGCQTVWSGLEALAIFGSIFAQGVAFVTSFSLRLRSVLFAKGYQPL